MRLKSELDGRDVSVSPDSAQQIRGSTIVTSMLVRFRPQPPPNFSLEPE